MNTLAYDQGKEMSEHKQFTIDTGIGVYFAHSGSPCERGTQENTNGLFREHFHQCMEFDTSRYIESLMSAPRLATLEETY